MRSGARTATPGTFPFRTSSSIQEERPGEVQDQEKGCKGTVGPFHLWLFHTSLVSQCLSEGHWRCQGVGEGCLHLRGGTVPPPAREPLAGQSDDCRDPDAAMPCGARGEPPVKYTAEVPPAPPRETGLPSCFTHQGRVSQADAITVCICPGKLKKGFKSYI